MGNYYYYLRGGSERVFFEHMKLLTSKGHQVLPFSVKDAHNFETEFERFFVQSMDFSDNQSLIRKIRTALRIIYSLENKRKIEALIETYPPDVTHFHNIYHRISPSVLQIVKSRDIPVLLTVHDYKLICPVYRLYRDSAVCELCKGKRFYHCLVHRCNKGSMILSLVSCTELYIHNLLNLWSDKVDYFITPSQFMKHKLIEFGFDERKIVHIPNFIYVDDYIPNYDSENYLIYFGRLSDEKGIPTMIKAFELLNSKKTELLIVGDGPLRTQLEAEVKTKGLGNIKFLGYLAKDRLLPVLGGAMASILPSEWYENAPMSVMESFAMGKPVIGARIGGTEEMIEDGMNGYLFESGNPEDLAEKISLLLSKTKEDVIEMGMLARKKAEEKYNAESHYHKLMSLYDKVLSEKENRDGESEGKNGFKSL